MHTTTQTKFNIIIVGAGIAGLSTAVGLGQQGHKVTILEAAHELAPVGIGIHIPPNATRVLKHFGMLDKLAKDAINPTGFVFRRWEDSSIIADVPAPKQEVMHEDGLPYWSMRRSDYQRHLYEAAIEAGCEIRLSARVKALDDDVPSVTLSSGEIIEADLVIAADGIKSHLRPMIIPEEEVSLEVNPMSAYRGYIEKADLLSDPITAPIFQGDPATNIWTGYARHVIVYPCGGGLYTLGATHPHPQSHSPNITTTNTISSTTTPNSSGVMDWSAPTTTSAAISSFHAFSPIVHRLFHHTASASLSKSDPTSTLKHYRLATLPRLPRWTSPTARAILTGDAAHAMLQFLAQGAAMATEDAAALSLCVSRAKSQDDIPRAMKAFERARKWRCEIVQGQARRNGEMIHLGDGEEQEQRDKRMRAKFEGGEGEEIDGGRGKWWTADLGPLVDDEFREWLYGFDVFEHTNKVLDEMGF